MEEFDRGETREEYIPRPRWQVWGARIALVLYFYTSAHPM